MTQQSLKKTEHYKTEDELTNHFVWATKVYCLSQFSWRMTNIQLNGPREIPADFVGGIETISDLKKDAELA